MATIIDSGWFVGMISALLFILGGSGSVVEGCGVVVG